MASSLNATVVPEEGQNALVFRSSSKLSIVKDESIERRHQGHSGKTQSTPTRKSTLRDKRMPQVDEQMATSHLIAHLSTEKYQSAIKRSFLGKRTCSLPKAGHMALKLHWSHLSIQPSFCPTKYIHQIIDLPPRVTISTDLTRHTRIPIDTLHSKCC